MKNIFKSRLFGIIAFAGFIAFSLTACGGGGGGGGMAGDGSSGNPYMISNATQLQKLAEEVNGGDDKQGVFYKLARNIDLSAYSAGAGWMPIGDSGNPFRGTFDGDYKVISGLAINTTSGFAGLFGQIENATVENLGVEIAVAGITGGNDVGAVAGYVALGSTVHNCYATGNVTGNNNVGGVAGYVSSAVVTNCYATGNVTGGDYVGGVAGEINGGGDVTNCYATGNVTGNGRVGGVAGEVYNGSSVSNCSALNPAIARVATSSNTTFGRVAGSTYAGSILTNNVAFEDMDLNDLTGGALAFGTGAPGNKDGADIAAGAGAGQYNNPASYSDPVDPGGFDGTAGKGLGWDLTSVWKWGAASNLPILYWQ